MEGKLGIEAGFAEEVQALKATATENFRAALGPYQGFPAAIREAMPRDAVFVRDITLNNSTWGNRIFPIYGPRDSVYPISAAIGPGMQLGIGAALGAGDRKVVAMCGDGGFFLNLAELWTAVQERTDVVFLVMNDKGYGVIKHIQDRMYEGRHYFGDLQSPDLEELARVAKIPFERVAQADEMGPALARAVAVDGPALVEVDMEAIGPYPPYFRPPPFVEEGK